MDGTGLPVTHYISPTATTYLATNIDEQLNINRINCSKYGNGREIIFINKTADIPNLIDQCSVASGATGALKDMRVTSSWTLSQKVSQISEDKSDIFDGLSSNDSDDLIL